MSKADMRSPFDDFIPFPLVGSSARSSTEDKDRDKAERIERVATPVVPRHDSRLGCGHPRHHRKIRRPRPAARPSPRPVRPGQMWGSFPADISAEVRGEKPGVCFLFTNYVAYFFNSRRTIQPVCESFHKPREASMAPTDEPETAQEANRRRNAQARRERPTKEGSAAAAAAESEWDDKEPLAR